MEIKLVVSQERLDMLSVDEMIVIEDVGGGAVNIKALKRIVAKFVANDFGEYLEEHDAMEVLGKLLRKQFRDVVLEFFKAVSNIAVNPMKDGN